MVACCGHWYRLTFDSSHALKPGTLAGLAQLKQDWAVDWIQPVAAVQLKYVPAK